MSGGKREARNCANWKDGECQSCGVQWQYFQVSGGYKCPHFTPRKPEPDLGRVASTCLETAYGSTVRLSYQIKVF